MYAIEQLETMRDVIEQNRAALTDKVADEMWNAYGRSEEIISIDQAGNIRIHENAANIYLPIGEVKIWSSTDYEYATPYDLWTLQDWTDVIAYTVGADYLPSVLDQVAEAAGAESAADYVMSYEQYENIEKIMQRCDDLKKIYDMIEADVKSDTEDDRRKAADMVIDQVIEDIIRRIEDLEVME